MTDPRLREARLADLGHRPTGTGDYCLHRWRNRTDRAVRCKFLAGWRAALQREDAPRPRSYEQWVEATADAIHETCRLEWRAIVAVDPGRRFTQHGTDAHYGMAHDLVRRLELAPTADAPVEPPGD